MSDVEFNETINGYRGAIGQLVFRKVNGRTVVSRKVKSRKPPTEAQLAQRARMKEAVAFGRSARVDPVLREFYGPIAQQRQSSIYQVALQDHLQKSSSKRDPLKLSELDEGSLPGLDLKIVAPDGTPIVVGKAVEMGVHSGKWTYIVTEPLAQGTVILLETKAEDQRR